MRVLARNARVVATATLLFAAAAPLAWCERHEPSPSARSTFACYCECNHKDKKRQCTRMCELPKYESRWWATSCHKRPVRPSREPAANPSHSPRRSGPEHARQTAAPLNTAQARR